MRERVFNYLLVQLLTLMLVGLAAAQPGELIEVKETGVLSPAEVDSRVAGRFRNNGEGPPAAVTPVATYLIRYRSTWPDGEPAEITAQLFVPRQISRPANLFVFAPGSTGLVEACAPSRSFVDAGSYDTYNAYTLGYAGQGMVALMPNYMGFFDVGVIQPYFDRVAEARVLLDGIRVTGEALLGLGISEAELPAFVGGYSQGGHAAFAAADLHRQYAPDVPLEGVVGFGPTNLMSALFLEFSYVAPWVIHSAVTFEPGRIDPGVLLLEPYLSRLADDAERLCILGAQGYYPGAAEGLFRPEFIAAMREGTLAEDFPEVASLFEENDAGLGGHEIPAIILQGVDDPVVPLDSQNEFVSRLCAAGSSVRYPNYLRTRHETRYIGFGDAIAWMRALLSGEEAPSDCDNISSEP